jgi:hypothetical protein
MWRAKLCMTPALGSIGLTRVCRLRMSWMKSGLMPVMPLPVLMSWWTSCRRLSIEALCHSRGQLRVRMLEDDTDSWRRGSVRHKSMLCKPHKQSSAPKNPQGWKCSPTEPVGGSLLLAGRTAGGLPRWRNSGHHSPRMMLRLLFTFQKFGSLKVGANVPPIYWVQSCC